MAKLEREQKTIAAMIRIFCNAHHETSGKLLCSTCAELLYYARERLERCPFGAEKGVCSKCEIHCYKPDMRKQVTEVMRYSGPRMLRKHPLLAIDHLLKLKGIGRRKGPDSPTGYSSSPD
ncbi:MAG: nitrous oxide-stimulated promoter family protein [Planctomycetota bacterium]